METIERVQRSLEANKDHQALIKEAQEVDTQWKQSRLNFLRNRAVLLALQDVAIEGQVDAKVKNDLQKRLFVADAADFQGLAVQQPQLSDPEGQVASQVNQRLRETCLSLKEHYDGNQDVSRLPELVAEDVEAVEAAEAAGVVPDLQAALSRREIEAKQERLLGQIIEEFRLRSAPEVATERSLHLEAKAAALSRKLAYIQTELKSLTYNSGSVRLLEKIRSKLDTQLAKAKLEVEQCRAQLAKYHGVTAGQGEYLQMVERYGQIQAEIAGKQWAMEKLDEDEQ